MCMYAVCIAKVYIHIYHSYIPNTYVQNFACICMYGMYLHVYAYICMHVPKSACCQQQQMTRALVGATLLEGNTTESLSVCAGQVQIMAHVLM